MAAMAMTRSPGVGSGPPNGAEVKAPASRVNWKPCATPRRAAASAGSPSPVHKHGVCRARDLQRFAQPSEREHQRPRHIVGSDDQQVHVSLEDEVLESIVEQVHVAAEARLGQPSSEVPVRRDEDGHAWQLTGEHQRFVT